MSFVLKGAREKRARIKSDMQAMSDRCHRENRGMMEDERKAFDRMKSEWDINEEQIRQLEDSDEPGGYDSGGSRHGIGKHNVSGRGGHDGDSYDGDTSAHGSREDRAYAFQAWAMSQYGLQLTKRHQSALRATGVDPRAREFSMPLMPLHKRAMSLTGASGGYTVKQDFSSALEKAMVDFSNIRGVCDEFRTDTGADLPYPTVDDTGNAAALLTEGSEVDYTDPVFSRVVFSAYKFSTGAVLISNELLQDSAFNLESELGFMLGERLGRGTGSYYTTGTGSSQPKGIVTCATAGPTTASATAITPDELTNLANSVDPAYRAGPKVGYMMKADVLSYLMKLKDADGHPLLRQSYGDGILQATINGFPVYLNQFMTGLTSNLPASAAKHVLFGDFSRFKIRDAGDIRLKRLDERWAEKDQVGFLGFLRTDSNIVKSGSVKYLLQA